MTRITPLLTKYLGPYIKGDDDPWKKPPPWMKTMTGSLALGGVLMGVYTLRARQSSCPMAMTSADDCRHLIFSSKASSTVSHDGAGPGA